MKEVQYQGHARAMPFDPVRVSNANVEQIARQGAQTLKYMQMAAEQDINNRKTQLDAMRTNSEFERQQRNTNERLASENRQARMNARSRGMDIRRQNTEQRLSDTQREIENQRVSSEIRTANAQQIYTNLSNFSATASKLVGEIAKDKYETDLTDEYTKTLMYGLPPEQALEQLKGEHELAIKGEMYEQKADVLEAQGADPHSVSYLRSLNPARKVGREKALAQMASANYNSWLDSQFQANNEFKLVLPGPEGNRELTPAQAETSADKAAFMTALMPEYLKQVGLFGKSSQFLGEALLNMRRAHDDILAKTKKFEAEEYNNQIRDQARDSYFDNPSDPFAGLQYFRTLARSKQNGVPLGFAAARQQLFKDVFLATDGQGNPRFSEEDIELLLAQPFDGQDRTPIGDRFSAEVAAFRRERSNLETTLYREKKAQEEQDHSEWNDRTREWLNSNWQGDPAELDPLIETAQKAGNEAGVKMLQMYSQDLSNTGRNDKFYSELFAEKELMGVLSVDEVLRSDTSTKFKLAWKERAANAEQNAVPKQVREDAEATIKSALARKLGELDTSKIKHESYGRAVSSAMRQYMSDVRNYMLRPNATLGEADEYALGRFQKEIERQGGSYEVSRIGKDNLSKGNFFARHVLKPTSAITFPLTQAREQLKADNNPQWSLQNRGLLDRAELEKLSQRASTGQPIRLPESSRYIANMTGVSPLDVVNAQLKYYQLDQIPVKAMQRTVASLDPEYQRLLAYQPNQTRVEIAGLGSGNVAAVPAKRIRGRVNSPSEILSTFIAAGGDSKEAVLMTAIAMAESSGRQDATRSDTDVHGWFQVRYPVHVDKLRALGITSRSQLLDPMNNTKAALAIRRSQGLGAWEAYTNGAYKRFLPQAEAAMRSFGETAWRQGSTMNFNVVQYLTGDTAYRHPKNNPQFYYAADHGGGNYHEHVGFRSRQDRDRAIAVLKKHGVKIGSMNDGVHAPGSLHYEDRAVDLPMPFNIAPGSREEQAYSRRVRQILGIPG
jgi:hypothetical protein